MRKTTPRAMAIAETGFDAAYLATVLVSGILLCASGAPGSLRWQFGLMALVLGIGDCFHLAPRVAAMWDRGGREYTASLGLGKLVTSITMTVFYILLWHIGTARYPGVFPAGATALAYALAALRVALCLFPQNRWTSAQPPLGWAILRNAPFLALGMLVMALFAAGSRGQGGGLSAIWLAILVSFACYLPVVLFSGRNRKVGMLMLPKSCAYAAIVLMGFSPAL